MIDQLQSNVVRKVCSSMHISVLSNVATVDVENNSMAGQGT